HGHAERVVAADRDDRVDAAAGHRVAHRRRAVGAVRVWVGTRGAEDRPAAREDADRAVERQLEGIVGEHAGPAVAVAEEAVTFGEPGPHGAADDGVQPGAVAAAGEHPDAGHTGRLGHGGWATAAPSVLGAATAAGRRAAR